MATQVMYFTNTDFIVSPPLFLNYSQSLKSKKVDSLPAITSNVRPENSADSVDLPSISESSPTNQAFQKQARSPHFALSTADEQSELQSLSVWARDLMWPVHTLLHLRLFYRLAPFVL